MDGRYIFYSSFFDKELLRRVVMVLDENAIDYRTTEKSIKSHFRAPLSGYFEVEIHISEIDFDKADELLKSILNKDLTE